ncbi:MAG: polysaccharide deacetylase family protein [Bacteroidales bacterium]|nr:polysaccharide deacetylase family protein [Bacteroidales bacterium]
MKKTIAALAIAISATAAQAQVPAEYQVAPWHGFSNCAITYSFDDLCANQLPIAIPMMDKYNVKGTLNIITSWVKPEQWAQVKDAAQRGHEIASHTISHPNMAELSVDEFERQQRDSKKILEEKTGAEVVTMVYPYCVTTHEDITAKYYIGARICDGRIEPHTPKEMMKISSLGVGSESKHNSSEALNKWVDEGARENGWCTFLIHGIDDDGGYSPIKSSELEAHIKYVAGNPRKFWPATFAQVCKYLMERNALQIDEQAQKKGFLITAKCNASSSLTTLNEPVTISRTLPEGWKSAAITCGKEKVSSRIENGKVIFDVVPGKSYSIRKK